MSIAKKTFDLLLHSLIINGVACLCDRLPIYPLSGGFFWFFLLVGYAGYSVVERKRNEAEFKNRSNRCCPNCGSHQIVLSNFGDYLVCDSCGCLIAKRKGVSERE